MSKTWRTAIATLILASICLIPIACTDGNSNNTGTTQVPVTFQGKIAFFSDRDGTADIYVMEGSSDNIKRLTSNSANNSGPVWSPDGAKIAFMSDRDGNYEVYVMNADGSNQIDVTNNPTEDSCGSWSPDGSKMVFQSMRDGNYEIYIMNPDGSNQTRLTDNPARDFLPSWMPDGRIAFWSERDGEKALFIMNTRERRFCGC